MAGPIREWVVFEVSTAQRAFTRTVAHPKTALVVGLGTAVAGAAMEAVIHGVPITALSLGELAMPSLAGGLAGLVIVFVIHLVAEPARRDKELAEQVKIQRATTPRPRIEAEHTGEVVRFLVWNDGAHGRFRATHQIFNAHPPLDHIGQMRSHDVYWLRLGAVGRDSEIFANDHDDFEVSLELRASKGIPASFFAARYHHYDTEKNHWMESSGEAITPTTPIEERWLDFSIIVTTEPKTESPLHVFRVYHDKVEKMPWVIPNRHGT